jgi:hypothetical protein
MSSISLRLPAVSKIEIPTFCNASEYLFKVVPSSKVSPRFKP